MNTYEGVDYYTASEVAKILNISKATVINRCKKNQYEGAYKEAGTSTNPNGAWLIPTTSIDTLSAYQDVVVLPRQMSPAQIERVFEECFDSTMTPLVREIKEQRSIIEKQQKIINEQNEQLEKIKIKMEVWNSRIVDLILDSDKRMEKLLNKKPSKGLISRLLGD